MYFCCTLSLLYFLTTDGGFTTDEDITEKGKVQINFQAHPNYGTLPHEKGSFSFSEQRYLHVYFSISWLLYNLIDYPLLELLAIYRWRKQDAVV